MSIKEKNDISKVAFGIGEFSQITENLLGVTRANFELEKMLPAFNEKTIEVIKKVIEKSGEVPVYELLSLQKKYSDIAGMFEAITRKNCQTITMLEENAETIPEFEVEEINLMWSKEDKEIEINSNTSEVKITAKEIEKISGISLEKCTKNQLILMVLSSIAMVSSMDNDGDYGTNVLLSSLKEIYNNLYEDDEETCSCDECQCDNDESFFNKQEDLFADKNANQSAKNSRCTCKDLSDSRKKSVQKKEMEEVMADVDDFNKTAVDEIVEEVEKKIAKNNNLVKLVKSILEEKESCLDDFKNEVPVIVKVAKPTNKNKNAKTKKKGDK